ncbi:polysaccharide biosynthesis/export family protein [Dyella flava]|nr:polysaccharide biosynthesis/export family protein [Dyella flava]
MKSSLGLPAVLVVLLVQGCAIVPGQHMSESALSNPDKGRVQLVQITPQWIMANEPQETAQTVAPELLNYQPQQYHIGAGDTLYITVWDHPELTAPAGAQQQAAANSRLVRSDGTLFYPYVGVIKAEGMTVDQLRDAIAQKLTVYVKNPQVDVSVISYGSQLVSFSGAFTKTDPQQITSIPLTLGQALGSATIDITHADLSNLILTRDGMSYHINLNKISKATEQSIYLKPGDRIYLPYNDNKEIYVMGEVVRPAAITFTTDDLSLTQALGRSGGLNPVTASGKSVYVIRGVKDLAKEPATVYHLNARSPAAFALADNFRVEPGDVVFVGPAAITEWGRFLGQLVPLSSLVGNAAFAREQINATP